MISLTLPDVSPHPPTHTFFFYQKREQELPIKRHYVIHHNWKADVKDVKKEKKNQL